MQIELSIGWLLILPLIVIIFFSYKCYKIFGWESLLFSLAAIIIFFGVVAGITKHNINKYLTHEEKQYITFWENISLQEVPYSTIRARVEEEKNREALYRSK